MTQHILYRIQMSPFADELWSLFVHWWMKSMSRFWRRNWLNISKSVFLSSRGTLLQGYLDWSKSMLPFTSTNLLVSVHLFLLSADLSFRIYILRFHFLRSANLSGQSVLLISVPKFLTYSSLAGSLLISSGTSIRWFCSWLRYIFNPCAITSRMSQVALSSITISYSYFGLLITLCLD